MAQMRKNYKISEPKWLRMETAQMLSTQWTHLWVTDGMKVMPFFLMQEYCWHYCNAVVAKQ